MPIDISSKQLAVGDNRISTAYSNFFLVRTKAGTTDDTAPIKNANPDGQLSLLVTKKIKIYLVFLDANGAEVSNGTANLTVCEYDKNSGYWPSGETKLGVGHLKLQWLEDTGKFWLMLTSIAGTGVASVQIRAAAYEGL